MNDKNIITQIADNVVHILNIISALSVCLLVFSFICESSTKEVTRNVAMFIIMLSSMAAIYKILRDGFYCYKNTFTRIINSLIGLLFYGFWAFYIEIAYTQAIIIIKSALKL